MMMKRLHILLLMSICISLGLSATNRFTLSTAEGQPTQEVTIDVAYENDAEAVAVELLIPLVKKQLTYVAGSAILNEERCNGHQISAAETAEGLRIVIYSVNLNPFVGDNGNLLSFRLKLGKDPLTYPLTCTAKVSDASGNPLETTVTPGAVTILAPELTVVTASMDYGHIPIRSSYTRTLQLRNSGNMPLEVANLIFSAIEFSASETRFSIEPGMTKDITVTYSPTLRGGISEEITIVSNAINGTQKASLIADPYSVNELHVGKADGLSDEEVEVTLTMNNMEPIVGVQCSFTLPEQLEYVEGSISTGERAQALTAGSSADDKNLTLFLYSINNEAIPEGDGVIAKFRLRLIGTYGTYYLTPKDVILSNITLENMTSASTRGSVTIRSPKLNSATSLNMGESAVTEVSSKVYSIRNNGNAPLVIERVNFLSEGYNVAETLPITIEPYKSSSINVQYTPTAEGKHGTTMNIYTNDPTNRMKSVAVTGDIFEPNYLAIDGNNTDTGYDLIFSMDNYTEIVAIQMEIEWISGMTTEDSLLALTDRLNGLAGTVWQIRDGVYGLLIYSLSNKAVSENSGDIFTLSFENNGAESLYSSIVKVNNIMLSDVTGTNYASHESIQFNPYLLGDSNGDGEVTAADVTNTRNKYMGVSVSKFEEVSADVNKDKRITAADVTGTRIIYMGNAE